MHVFQDALPRSVSTEELSRNTTSFSVNDVKKWVEKHGAIQGRFQFFETFAANSEFYLKVAKPLTSMSTVGSIATERKIKPIKNNMLTKCRNCLSDPKGVMLMRAGENLKHIMRAKKILGKKITDSL
jgi:hypothetical protein